MSMAVTEFAFKLWNKLSFLHLFTQCFYTTLLSSRFGREHVFFLLEEPCDLRLTKRCGLDVLRLGFPFLCGLAPLLREHEIRFVRRALQRYLLNRKGFWCIREVFYRRRLHTQ